VANLINFNSKDGQKILKSEFLGVFFHFPELFCQIARFCHKKHWFKTLFNVFKSRELQKKNRKQNLTKISNVLQYFIKKPNLVIKKNGP
jgi:hypothetical protein